MKQILFTILLSLVGYTSYAQSESADETAIKKTIFNLVKGQDLQNGNQITSAFRQEASIFATHQGTKILSLPVAKFAAVHESKQFGGHKREMSIESISISDDIIASAKVIAENQKVHYVYYLTLTNVENKWLIQSYLQHSKMKE